MLENLLTAFKITMIGMGLVFAAIILLWAVMVVLIRVLGEQKIHPKQVPSTEEPISLPDRQMAVDRKMRAAAAAVVCALMQNRQAPREFPLPPTAIVSAWQAVARSNMLKRGRVR
jgi:Na+-transporting methylmalonyl-CoA/oxaloacetate decarboxylase gamma subunit